MFKNYECFINLVNLTRLGTILKPNSRQMVHNAYIFININWHAAHTIASKTGTYISKRKDFLQGSCYVNTFKEDHRYAYFLKMYLILYFRARFQLFINILTSFRRGDFIPTRKQTAERLTQIKQSFCKRRSKFFIDKISDFTFAADFGHETNSFIWDFSFSKPVNLGTSVRKI